MFQQQGPPSQDGGRTTGPGRLGSVAVQLDAQATARAIQMPNLPRPLNLEEKRYLLAVERGDIAAVRRCVEHRTLVVA